MPRCINESEVTLNDNAPIGLLLLQLGTPGAPTPQALRRYLREFLSDRRVIDLPRWQWLPILYLIVLRTRPRASAELYRKVWTKDGSPLATMSARQASLLESKLTAAGRRVRVAVGMRYGEPSIASALKAFTDAGITRILAFPMYPQYAGATTGSSLEKLFEIARTLRVVPSLRVVPPYFTDTGYIRALAQVAKESMATLAETPELCLLSFHGLPARYAKEGDPYPDHCAETTRCLREAWGDAPQLAQTYQSRFGREEWLQPYTDVTLEELGRRGSSVAVMCPGFTADCLETLEEIGIRGDEQYTHAGGKSFHRIPCLNDHPAWIDAMAAITERELRGW